MREDGGWAEQTPADDEAPGGTLGDGHPGAACQGGAVAGDGSSRDGARGGQRLEGLVTAIAPGFFEVAAGGRSYLCTLRGRLRKPPLPPALVRRGAGPHPATKTGKRAANTASADEEAQSGEHVAQPPARIAPGDRVLITPLSEHEGVIEEALPRRTVLVRSRRERAAERVMLANPDLAVLVFATREPEPHFSLLDRYLALCEHAGVQPLVCINKDDLGVPGEVGVYAAQYVALGYPVLYTSAATGDGVAALRERLAGKISLLTGESGVGKSSLTNLLAPDARQRTAEVSQARGLGRHTTTGVRLLSLSEGGWLADSAGIRELSLWNVPSDELARCFVELRPFVGQCLYEDCTHSPDEDSCALRAALASGVIAPSRWASFERLLEEARAEEKPDWVKR
jgi:ribosome biogenesis GTPase